LQLSDLVSNMKATKELEINLKDYKSPIVASGVEFTQEADSTDFLNKPDFIRYGNLITPAASMAFDSDKDQPGFYFELYPNRNTPDIFGIKYEITEIGGELALSDSFTVSANDSIEGVVPVMKQLDIAELSPANYEFKLGVYNIDFRQNYTTRSKEFYIDWSLATLVERDFDYAVDILRYIALSKERDSIKNSVVGSRLEAIQAFWKQRDPSPGTTQNELREEYYSRVRYANRNFSGHGRPGYLTDFGRIYITYGKPEEIERHPFDIDAYPREIWYYYRYHREFLFVDKTGFGHYELAYPGSGARRLD